MNKKLETALKKAAEGYGWKVLTDALVPDEKRDIQRAIRERESRGEKLESNLVGIDKADIIEALRKRGIDFVVNDGLRGLTRSKGANDEELKRALEEAGRRHANPVAAKLPSA